MYMWVLCLRVAHILRNVVLPEIMIGSDNIGPVAILIFAIISGKVYSPWPAWRLLLHTRRFLQFALCYVNAYLFLPLMFRSWFLTRALHCLSSPQFPVFLVLKWVFPVSVMGFGLYLKLDSLTPDLRNTFQLFKIRIHVHSKRPRSGHLYTPLPKRRRIWKRCTSLSV